MIKIFFQMLFRQRVDIAQAVIFEPQPLNSTGVGLGVGVLTNKGIIKEIIEDIHPRYNTDAGSYCAGDLVVLKIMFNG